MKIISGIILMLLSCIVFGVMIFKDIQFGINCDGHMSRAAHANTVEMAMSEMQVVVNYLRENGLTNGYTSIMYRTPDEDIGFFYNNMRESLEELQKVTLSTTALEKSNLLLKLRETLMSHGEHSSSVNLPRGISLFPLNGMYCILAWASLLVGCLGIALIITH